MLRKEGQAESLGATARFARRSEALPVAQRQTVAGHGWGDGQAAVRLGRGDDDPENAPRDSEEHAPGTLSPS